MKRFLLEKYKTLILSGLITFGFAFLQFQLGYVFLDAGDMPKTLFVLINILGFLLPWSFLAFLLDKYPMHKVLGVVGLLVLAVLAEHNIHIRDNPITIPLIILFWLGLSYFILPQFFKKYQIAILSVYGVIIAYHVLGFMTTIDYGQEDRARFAGFMLMPIPVFAALWMYEQWRWVRMLKADRTRAELALLKTQVNPHFFFNTLNNLYGLVVEQSPEAPEVVLRLSDMMRYTIYEGKEESVRLIDEVNYLETYIELHKIRYHKNVDIQFDHEVDKDVQVPPLLFINLLENAFKHGVEPLTENAYIHLSLKTQEHQVHFNITNNYEASTPCQKEGIGLDNLKKRLTYSYPNRHALTIEKTPTRYTADLKLLSDTDINK